jgi:hypothetical protein
MNTPAASVEDYRKAIMNINLIDRHEVCQLTALLDCVPYSYIDIAHHKGQIYRLKPTIDLLATEEEDWWEENPYT